MTPEQQAIQKIEEEVGAFCDKHGISRDYVRAQNVIRLITHTRKHGISDDDLLGLIEICKPGAESLGEDVSVLALDWLLAAEELKLRKAKEAYKKFSPPEKAATLKNALAAWDEAHPVEEPKPKPISRHPLRDRSPEKIEADLQELMHKHRLSTQSGQTYLKQNSVSWISHRGAGGEPNYQQNIVSQNLGEFLNKLQQDGLTPVEIQAALKKVHKGDSNNVPDFSLYEEK